MNGIFDIAEVARRTGLTSRTLRFYETRGLVAPLRAESGRRLYGLGELQRINQIVALKRAGLTLSQIQRALVEREVDLVALVDEQLAALEVQQAEIARARALLVQAIIQIEPGGETDAVRLCALIRQGIEKQEACEVAPMFEGLDLEAMKAGWADLTRRIESAMPIDPASDRAQALFDEIEPLFAPFFSWWKARGAEVRGGPGEPPARIEQLPGWPRFSAQVWQFMFAVKRHRANVSAAS